METFEKRLTRFLDGDAHELSATLLNSIRNHLVVEIEEAGKRGLESLIFLGTHAIMQTVSEALFDRTGVDGTRYYLQRFVDGEPPDRRFSEIADTLHDLRNVTAHEWLSFRAHNIVYDYTKPEGWTRSDDLLTINPEVYLECFLSGFRRGGPIWDYRNFWPENERFTRKYKLIARWLDLGRKDPIRNAIAALESAPDSAARDAAESEIRRQIRERYGL